MFRLNISGFTRIHLILVSGVSILWVGYVALYYYQTREEFKASTITLLSQTQVDVNEAVDQLHAFLSLTGSRILQSYEKKDRLVSILSFRAEHFITKKFPHIVGLSLVLASDPTTVYTRLGKSSQKTSQEVIADTPLQISKPPEEATYVGDGTFEITRILTQDQKTIGILKATFSLKAFLYKHFAEDEIHIIPLHGEDVATGTFSFVVKNLSYAFVLNKTPPSFWEFLREFKIHLLLALLYGVSLASLGSIFGERLSKRIAAHYRAQGRALKEELEFLQEKFQDLTIKTNEKKSHITLSRAAYKERARLWHGFEERQRHMAGQILAILNLTEKLITSQGMESARSRAEIHDIFQESLGIAKHLMNGFPMKGREEEIDVLQSLMTLKKIFLPELKERNITVDIKEMSKKKERDPPVLDKLIFEIVLHNVFYLVVDRLINKNLLKIEIKASDPLEIIFYDNGYDVRDKIQNAIHTHIDEDILCLGKQRLREFMKYLGWQISFSADKNALNVVKLSFPQHAQDTELSSNVVNLFDSHPLLK